MRRLRAGRHSTTAMVLAALLIGSPGVAGAEPMQGDDAASAGGSGARAAQPPAQDPQGRSARAGSERTADPRARNRDLADRVFAELVDRSPDYATVDVSAEGGVITLSGAVPSEGAEQRAIRVARRTPGVAEVQNEMRVEDAAVMEEGEPLPDAELARRVARAIADRIPGAKAGEDWWFTGWRVEGPQNTWNFVVEADRGSVTLEGDVPRSGIVTAAVQAARDVAGVQTVDSQLELPAYAYGSPYPHYGYGYVPGYYTPHSYVIYVPEEKRDANVARGEQGMKTGRKAQGTRTDAGMQAGTRGTEARAAGEKTGTGTRAGTGAPAQAAAETATLRGEITRIDRNNETMTVDTQAGAVTLPLPQAEGMDLAAGDRVQVDVAIREQSRRSE